MGYEKYLGIPFKHLGRDRKGLDCYGLLILYYKEEFGIDILDWSYEPDWSKKGANYFIQEAPKVSKKVTSIQTHDVVLFYTDLVRKVVNHAGIVVQAPNKVIQAMKTGVTLTDISTPVFKRRVEGFYRIWQK